MFQSEDIELMLLKLTFTYIHDKHDNIYILCLCILEELIYLPYLFLSLYIEPVLEYIKIPKY